MIDTADYIIVGAGSAGCVLAAELSSDPSNNVLLVESGPADRHFLIDMPRGVGKLMAPGNPHIWSYDVTKAGNRGTEKWVKGRAIGGSSSVNGMIYARGFASDYDRWAELGCTGWGWADMVPHFKAMEDHELGETPERGVGGPLRISTHPRKVAGDELCEAVIDAAAEAGTPRVADTNASPQGGIGYQARTIWKGKRQSAAKAFLRPALARKNLTVISDTDVLRILFDGQRASGVEVRDASGVRRIDARREIIVSAGAIQSPKLLQLSGIGPARLLQDLGIAVVHDQPQVGRNLREHFYLQTKYRVKRGSLNHEFAGPRLLWNVLRYVIASSGPMTHAAQELIGYVKTEPALSRPDCQIGVGLYSMGLGPKGLELDKEPGLTIGGYPMHPVSLGEMHIVSADPDAAPYILANYLTDPEDQATAVRLVRYIRKIASQPALAELMIEEMMPGRAVQTDDEILADYLARGGTAYHVAGTCRMGSDAASVVDPLARVRGVSGLRVVDTSIFPELPSGNTNAPAMAAGRNVAMMIRKDR
ncbi:GMC family oxidoreductase [Sphingomonas immobilis]|uniref:GMC family oxidoreductase N-terminal domain-containing protein n=1 Tax=Sphingomonas immobilis TaxID=3063997 RepID=A0ABT8ZT83_9SPHN|nr:GMC family oxidoreductase N-terminal domain-containing protein [Sphingomonas sp. CA1-15]MDO7840775.1 GMC family oxidoreductase N-terminal domain-containing protein [Sphingomonas sp. CA1-15]